MAIQLLRVGPNWTKVSSPEEQEYFFMNNSGSAVKFFFSDVEVNTDVSTAIPQILFTMGGCIGQVKAPSNKYMYAKVIPFRSPIGTVLPEGTVEEAVLMKEIEPIDEHDVYSAMMKIITEIMRLSTRVTENEYRHVKGHVDHLRNVKEIKQVAYQNLKSIYRVNTIVVGLFNRLFDIDKSLVEHTSQISSIDELLTTYIATTDATLVDLSLEIKDVAYQEHMNTVTTDRVLMSILQRLLAAERFVSDARYQVNGLLTDVSSLKQLQIDQAEFSLFVEQVRSIILNVNELNEEVVDLYNRHGTAATDIRDLRQHFAEINNAMETLALNYSPEQIDVAFSAVLDATSEFMQPTIQALKDIIYELATARLRDAEHSRLIDQKLDKDSLIILSPETTDLANFGE